MDTAAYLSDFRARHTLTEVVGWLDRISKLRPLVIGEAILDVYEFCRTLGVSSKDPTLAVLKERVETYAGGSLAVANHLAGLCGEVRLITRLGTIDRREDFISASLAPNVSAYFLTQPGAPTICKTRIVEQYSGTKLIETYCMDDNSATDTPYDYEINQALTQALAGSDLVLVADFGHGLLDERVAGRLWAAQKYLCLNCQSNAGNRGYNTISRYKHAHYICLANHEVDIETRRRGGDDRDKLREVMQRVDCKLWTITRGKFGTLHYDGSQFHEAPALATKVVDRVGAGDSVFAVTSLLARVGCPWPILALIGNAAGALQVEVLGNKQSITRAALETRISELMKG
jgi:bifunctional ADP-heptose synthase (sugar kinase/adenylyltransferase)